jgi:glutaredoxin
MSVVFYTRAGCHLCEDARAMLDATGVAYRSVDVDDDRELQRAYGERVPVIEVDGAVVAEGNLGGVPLGRLIASAKAR